MKEELKTKKKKRSLWHRLTWLGRLVVLVVVIAALSVALFVLFSGVLHERQKEDLSHVQPVVVGYDDVKDDDANPTWYYNESRDERYEEFAALWPELSMEDVIWMVEADLDKPPYENVREILEPDSLTALVNKHFHLPEDYVPSDLENIGNSMLRADAAAAMRELINDASAEGHTLWVQSGFRSYSTQAGLYQQYSARDGTAIADTYSARASHSEHQTGLAVDFNTISDAFGSTSEGRWAAENSWRYGYILRYTDENKEITLYKSEPWHFRYVGREAASEMQALGITTYEEYWVKYIKNQPPAGDSLG